MLQFPHHILDSYVGPNSYHIAREPSFAHSIGEALAEILWPTRCVSCDEPESLLCEECRAALPWIQQQYACPNCGAPFGELTCTECDKSKGELWETRSCICALPLAGIARRLILTYKDAGEKRLAPILAAIIATALDEASFWCALDGRLRFDASTLDAITFVPATAKAFQKRGYDHMELITSSLSEMLNIPYIDALARPKGKDQRSLGRAERTQNTKGEIHVVHDVQDCSILLVDDVITTGASVRASAQALLAQGAREVSICSVARTW